MPNHFFGITAISLRISCNILFVTICGPRRHAEPKAKDDAAFHFPENQDVRSVEIALAVIP